MSIANDSFPQNGSVEAGAKMNRYLNRGIHTPLANGFAKNVASLLFFPDFFCEPAIELDSLIVNSVVSHNRNVYIDRRNGVMNTFSVYCTLLLTAKRK
jgi:hypothetical protein